MCAHIGSPNCNFAETVPVGDTPLAVRRESIDAVFVRLRCRRRNADVLFSSLPGSVGLWRASGVQIHFDMMMPSFFFQPLSCLAEAEMGRLSVSEATRGTQLMVYHQVGQRVE